jgi:hypothetical protein
LLSPTKWAAAADDVAPDDVAPDDVAADDVDADDVDADDVDAVVNVVEGTVVDPGAPGSVVDGEPQPALSAVPSVEGGASMQFGSFERDPAIP